MGGDPATDAVFNAPGVASQLGPWVLIAILLAPKLLDWYREIRGQKSQVDAARVQADAQKDTAKETSQMQVEIEQIKGSYARQESFQNTLVARVEAQMNEIEALLDRISILNGNLMQRDESIRQKDAKMLEMQRQIDRMQVELDELKKHVKKIEADRDAIKASCPIAIVEVSKE